MIADRYSLDREIGRGGMGAVWLGHDEVLGRLVALKRIGMPPGGAGDNPETARAEREAKLAASLSHPNVVSVFDLAADGDLHWLVMEYVEGTNLAELIRSRGTLGPEEAAPILAQVADALCAAHAAGVVHRDVKPSNILVTPEGQVKLSDFGIARTVGDASLTQTGLVTGSPAYLSPEVASGRSASAKSDLWSFGATAYHMVEGHPPYEIGDNLLGALYRIVHEEPPRASTPGWLAPMIEATMERDEDARWDATEVRAFLRSGASRSGAAVAPTRRTPRPAGPPPPPVGQGGHTQVLHSVGTDTREVPVPARRDEERTEGRRRRLPWAIAIAALAAAAVLVGVLVAVLNGGDGGTDPQAAASTPSSSPSTTPSPDAPTEAGMTSFIQTYLATAPTDQTKGFAMLTPSFQTASQGFDKYAAFWRQVSDVQVRSLTPDPESLRVTYDYSYRLGRAARDETVILQLDYVDGAYLIAGDLSDE